jgi:hypothetical protein
MRSHEFEIVFDPFRINPVLAKLIKTKKYLSMPAGYNLVYRLAAINPQFSLETPGPIDLTALRSP